MRRVAGSTDAKRAWVHLRGPYMLGYIAYLLFSLTAPAGVPENRGAWWAWVSTIMAVVLIAGSASSWMVVSQREPKHFWKSAEALEVTALRIICAFELVYGSWGVFFPPFPTFIAILHIFIGLMFLGILSNMTWHKVRFDARRG